MGLIGGKNYVTPLKKHEEKIRENKTGFLRNLV